MMFNSWHRMDRQTTKHHKKPLQKSTLLQPILPRPKRRPHHAAPAPYNPKPPSHKRHNQKLRRQNQNHPLLRATKHSKRQKRQTHRNLQIHRRRNLPMRIRRTKLHRRSPLPKPRHKTTLPQLSAPNLQTNVCRLPTKHVHNRLTL